MAHTITYAIENTTAATISIHSVRFNTFLSTWGAVVRHNDYIRELSGHDSGEVQLRLLLVGCIEALQTLPKDVAVVITSPADYLPRWVIGALPELAKDHFAKARRQKKANLDLIEEIHRLSLKRAPLIPKHVGKDQWTEDMKQAESLAKTYQVDAEDQRFALSEPRPFTAVAPRVSMRPKPLPPIDTDSVHARKLPWED